MQWAKRQRRRLRRSLAIAPRLVVLICKEPYHLIELCRVVFFQGFEGLKAFGRQLEAQTRAACASADARARDRAMIEECLKRIDDDKLGYVIMAPPYVSNSAGIGCLYRLCHDLNRRGYPSYIVGSNRTAPGMAAPLVGNGRARRLCNLGYTAVYPETIFGNPLHAPRVARYVENIPGLLGGEKVYDDSELVFYYCNAFLPYIQNRIAGKLYIPTIDESIFYPGDRDFTQRQLECFYVGKSTWKDGYIDKDKVFEITRDTPPKKELGKLLRASRVLYCFDNSTIFSHEALLCGCAVVIIPDGTQTKEDYLNLELGMDGIAWGMDELEKVKAVDIDRLRQRYEQLKQEYPVLLEQFISKTQNHSPEALKYSAA